MGILRASTNCTRWTRGSGRPKQGHFRTCSRTCSRATRTAKKQLPRCIFQPSDLFRVIAHCPRAESAVSESAACFFRLVHLSCRPTRGQRKSFSRQSAARDGFGELGRSDREYLALNFRKRVIFLGARAESAMATRYRGQYLPPAVDLPQRTLHRTRRETAVS